MIEYGREFKQFKHVEKEIGSKSIVFYSCFEKIKYLFLSGRYKETKYFFLCCLLGVL